jgi:hypothetical protein
MKSEEYNQDRRFFFSELLISQQMVCLSALMKLPMN